MSKVTGFKELKINFKDITNKILGDISENALFDLGAKVLELSEFEVPLDEGTLLRSGTVQKQGKKTIIGYNTEYAAKLHYHPEYRFKNGRKGQYLTDPVQKNEASLMAFVQQQFIKRVNKIL